MNMNWEGHEGFGHAEAAALESKKEGFMLALIVCVKKEDDNVRVEIYREAGLRSSFYRDVLAQYILNAEFEDAG